MSTDSMESTGLYSRLPFSVRLGLALISLVYGVAVLTDTINDPIPNDVWAVIWFVVAALLVVRTVRLSMQP